MILTFQGGPAAQPPDIGNLQGVGVFAGPVRLRLVSGPAARVTLVRYIAAAIDDARLGWEVSPPLDVDASAPVVAFGGPGQGPRYPGGAVTSIAPHTMLVEVPPGNGFSIAHVVEVDLTKQLAKPIGTQRCAGVFVAIAAGSPVGTYVFEET